MMNRPTKTWLSKGSTLLACLTVSSIAVAGCSSSDSSGSKTAGGASGKAAQNALANIKRTGTLTVGVRFSEPPYGSVPQGSSEPVGFSVDLARAVGKTLGAKKVKFVEVNSQNRIPFLTSGKVDILFASIYVTPPRAKVVSFGLPVLKDANKFLVPTDSKITGESNLAGKTLGVSQGAAQKEQVLAVAPKVKVREYQDWPTSLTAMFNGQIDGIVASTGILIGLKQAADKAGKKVKLVGAGFSPNYVAPAVAKTNPQLLKAVNDALLQMEADGSYAKIFKKWWGDSFPSVYHIKRVDFNAAKK